MTGSTANANWQSCVLPGAPRGISKNVVDAARDAGHPARMAEDCSDLLGHAGMIARRAYGGVAWV